MALGDADADRLQQRDQTLNRHLALVMLHQHEPAQLRAEMAADAAGQRRHDRLTLRRQPALASIAHHPRREYQILHLIRLVAFELRTLRRRYPKHLGLGCDPRRHLATAAAFCPLGLGLRLGRLLHAAGLDGRAALQTFQPGDLVALRRNEPLQISHLAQQFYQQSFQLGTRQIGQTGGGNMQRANCTRTCLTSRKSQSRPGLCPDYLQKI